METRSLNKRFLGGALCAALLALAGCDRLTISPDLLQKLADADAPVERRQPRGDQQRQWRAGGRAREHPLIDPAAAQILRDNSSRTAQ